MRTTVWIREHCLNEQKGNLIVHEGSMVCYLHDDNICRLDCESEDLLVDRNSKLLLGKVC